MRFGAGYSIFCLAFACLCFYGALVGRMPWPAYVIGAMMLFLSIGMSPRR